MPTYQYRCTACSEPLEAVQRFTDPALRECPSCGGALRKVFSAVGVVFKGSGFYQTDSRSKPKGEPATKAADPAKEGKEASRPAAGTEGGAKADRSASPKPAAETAGKPAKKEAAGAGSHKVA